ncbi:Hypothetical protein Cul131001_0458 [Corynebacterium ulcerans]|nr:Hypothetical protein Cul131001_0458 [Corynebacterium ulcerans]
MPEKWRTLSLLASHTPVMRPQPRINATLIMLPASSQRMEGLNKTRSL